ncbi:MAG: hypothetical protein EOM50_17780 [Erysipelotrichia bacterium]|nr:hypothetical protein [Erysipelotrichia bacterium]
MASLVSEIKSKVAQKKTRIVKIKVQLDNQTAEELQFIIDNSKRLLGVDSCEYFAEMLVEPKKKTINQLYTELKKELENNSPKDKESVQ